MTISSGGVHFSVEFSSEAFPGESSLLDGMPRAEAPQESPFHIMVEGVAPSAVQRFERGESFDSKFVVDGHILRLTHRLFTIEIDSERRRTHVWRAGGSGLALTHAIRASLLTVLPLEDGIALHSCGVTRRGRAIAFHGRSGAGKTTLAGTCPWMLLSDELVVIRRTADGWVAHPSGFWGGARPATTVVDTAAKLTALVALDKGPRYELTTLSRDEAVRALSASVQLPPTKTHWEATLRLLADLAHSVQQARMAWTPAAPPWDALDALL